MAQSCVCKKPNDRELKKEMLMLKKQVIEFRDNTRKFSFDVTKYRYSNKELSTVSYYLKKLKSILCFAKINGIWAITYAKATIGFSIGTAGVGLCVFGLAGIVFFTYTYKHVSSEQIFPNKHNVEQIEQTMPASLPEDKLRMDPIFKPKYATVILTNNQSIECKITDFTQTYISVEVNGERKLIAKRDICEIRSI